MNDKKQNSSEFFQNRECQYFPCHKVQNVDNFNCMFCFCPLYFLENCGGNFKYTEKGVKDCVDCLVPHLNREYVINKIKLENSKKSK
ncbi:MAG: cysteine-rich small domain-containing protein [Clostridia bacterium]